MSLVENESMMSPEDKIKELSARIHALEELLEVSEQSFLAGASELEEANARLRILNENFLSEIQERKKAEENLSKAYNELKHMHIQLLQSDKMASIGQLAAGVAHEINNPTGFILSNLASLRKYSERLSEFISIQSEALEKISASNGQNSEAVLNIVAEYRKARKVDYITKDIIQLIDESIEGGTRVKQIVQNLKSFSHIDESEYKLSDINTIIENTLTVIWNELKYKTTVAKDYGDVPPTLCNSGQLSQVFMNILINAAHAIETQGQIMIKTRCEKETIIITLSDTGGGIHQEIIGKIFEPFFTTKDVGKGTGLGLSIAYDIVTKHNGQIDVESQPGKGTTFTIMIPVAE
ncbi:MAG TPA: ATP-binding protein [Dissulfurispiraceae bacterium]|nr:ATP-binding protein [Dissulfurispiraceae bacterium]